MINLTMFSRRTVKRGDITETTPLTSSRSLIVIKWDRDRCSDPDHRADRHLDQGRVGPRLSGMRRQSTQQPCQTRPARGEVDLLFRAVNQLWAKASALSGIYEGEEPAALCRSGENFLGRR